MPRFFSQEIIRKAKHASYSRQRDVFFHCVVLCLYISCLSRQVFWFSNPADRCVTRPSLQRPRVPGSVSYFGNILMSTLQNNETQRCLMRVWINVPFPHEKFSFWQLASLTAHDYTSKWRYLNDDIMLY